jgi:succinyl-CoA synthetase beta subunit
VARHPELKIEIAREFDHPPTALERSLTPSNKTIIAAHFISHSWQRRHRKDSKGLVGFHGAGGGGSMMSMDAIVNAGFTIANFTDTSGNPSASKVYRGSESFWPNPIWWDISVRAPALRARNNIGPRTDWPRRFGNSISTFPQ